MQGTGFGLDRLCFSQSWERSQGQAGMKSAPVEETWNSAAPRGLWQRPGVPPAYYSGFWILDSDAASFFLALGIPLCPTFARVGTWQAAQPYRYPSRQAAKPLSEGAVRAQQKKRSSSTRDEKEKDGTALLGWRFDLDQTNAPETTASARQTFLPAALDHRIAELASLLRVLRTLEIGIPPYRPRRTKTPAANQPRVGVGCGTANP